jgi:excinuclease ABC subunit C
VTPGALARVALAGEPEPALAAVPPRPGVGQILGPEGGNLVLATTQNLRKWAGAQLGQAPKRREGAPVRRPRTNLAGIATAVAWIETDGPFRQRLAYERLSASLVPPPKRRDLKPPAFLHLDPAERFPRVSVRGPGAGPLYGPFRDRRAAEKARDALQRAIPLRPCDFTFEPDSALPLGLGCLYAQVRSCAAPCLARVSEEEYRELAAQAARWLADPARRSDAPVSVPASLGAAFGRAVVVDAGRRSIGLLPVAAGRVLDAAVLETSVEELERAVDRLAWPEQGAGEDWPWLTGWLRSPRARAAYVVVSDAMTTQQLREAVTRALAKPFAGPAAGGNVGNTREER